MVEHFDPARCIAGLDEIRRVFAKPRHCTEHPVAAPRSSHQDRHVRAPPLSGAAAALRICADRQKARDFFPVIATLLAWGNKHLAPKGEAILLANRDDRRPLDPVVVDAADRRPITLANAVVIAGPRASRLMRRRLTALKAMNPDLAPAGD
jgi:hypothetical protein